MARLIAYYSALGIALLYFGGVIHGGIATVAFIGLLVIADAVGTTTKKPEPAEKPSDGTAYQRGYTEGFIAGARQGQEEGYKRGLDDGFMEGTIKARTPPKPKAKPKAKKAEASRPPPRPEPSVAEHWRILGLRPGASERDITLAYRKLALKNHPDRGGSLNAMKKLNGARATATREAKLLKV